MPKRVMYLLELIVSLVIAYYMYTDAKRRYHDDTKPLLWLIAGLVGGIVALIIYLLVRPEMRYRRLP